MRVLPFRGLKEILQKKEYNGYFEYFNQEDGIEELIDFDEEIRGVK